MTMRPLFGFILLLVAASLLTLESTAFVVVVTLTPTVSTKKTVPYIGNHDDYLIRQFKPNNAIHHHHHHQSRQVSTTRLEMASLSSSALFRATSLLWSTFKKRAVVLSVVAISILWFFQARLLWPGTSSDRSNAAPLPEAGSMGCPFVGHVSLFNTDPKVGPFALVPRLFNKLGKPNLFRLYSFFMPIIAISGTQTLKEAMSNEFQKDSSNDSNPQKTGLQTLLPTPGFRLLLGEDPKESKSIIYQNDKTKHAMLRRLMGVGMTPQALKDCVPTLVEACNDQMSKLKEAASNNGTVIMESIAQEFTLDVAWRQILGLKLQPSEKTEFRKLTFDWMQGLLSPNLYLLLPFLLPGFRQTKVYKAKSYLTNLIADKLDQLDQTGPDGSTLSGIYFAVDDENGSRMSREEVLENALTLMFAGFETSAVTLSNAVLLLGLNKDVFSKIQEEQKELIARKGEELSKTILDNDCPYLNAVLSETLRMKPFPILEFRQAKSTVVVDGVQIPKNWYVMTSISTTQENDPVTYEEDGSHMDMDRGFNPDRWLKKATTPIEYIPWGIGARRCLGEKLALLEMKVFLATMAREFESFDLVNFSSGNDVRYRSSFGLYKAKDGVEIRPKVGATISV